MTAKKTKIESIPKAPYCVECKGKVVNEGYHNLWYDFVAHTACMGRGRTLADWIREKGFPAIPENTNLPNIKMSETKPTPMTQEDLIKFHEDFCKRARDLMIKKNSDYGATEDPFANFRMTGRFGILVRLSDKISRLVNLAKKGFASVEDETVTDTEIDTVNYAILSAAYAEDEKRRNAKG